MYAQLYQNYKKITIINNYKGDISIFLEIQ